MELANAAAYVPGTAGRHCVCTHQMAALFCVKWRHGRHLKRMSSNKKIRHRQSMLIYGTSRTTPPNFSPMRVETKEPLVRLFRRGRLMQQEQQDD